MDYKIGLIIQLSGVFFVTTLLFLLTHSLRSTSLLYWKRGWLALSAGLVAIQLGFAFPGFVKFFLSVHYFTQYVFLFFLIAGCHKFSTRKPISNRSLLLLFPALVISAVLAFSEAAFLSAPNVQTLLLAVGFLVAFQQLKPSPQSHDNPGTGVIRFALFFLTLDFFHDALFSGFVESLFPDYWTFNPILDLLLQILLGFGMVIALLQRVRLEVEEINTKLKAAHEKLEAMVQTDPLTTAFNRHAFYGFVHKSDDVNAPISGCVGFFDIDNLKPINDQYGHSVGDAVIREVTRAIRDLIRAEDLIFRWGGDEFFVVMVGMDSELACERMQKITENLTNIKVLGVTGRLTVGVSFGFTDFKDASEIEDSVKIADELMYKQKQKKKQTGESQKQLTISPNPPVTAKTPLAIHLSA